MSPPKVIVETIEDIFVSSPIGLTKATALVLRAVIRVNLMTGSLYTDNALTKVEDEIDEIRKMLDTLSEMRRRIPEIPEDEKDEYAAKMGKTAGQIEVAWKNVIRKITEAAKSVEMKSQELLGNSAGQGNHPR